MHNVRLCYGRNLVGPAVHMTGGLQDSLVSVRHIETVAAQATNHDCGQLKQLVWLVLIFV